MQPTSYGQFLKPIPPFQDYGSGYCRQGTEMDRYFFGYDLNVRYGSFHNSGKLFPYQTQVCDYDQTFLFIGTHTHDPGYLGAQIDFCLGEKKDKHRITTATSITVPRGMPWGPITIGPMAERFIFLQVAIAAEVQFKPVLPDTPEGPMFPFRAPKDQEYVKQLAFVRNGPWHYGPLNPDTHDGYITDIKPLGFDFSMSYETMNQAPYRFTPAPDVPHTHSSYTEFLMFLGCDCNDLSAFPAEVEVCMGKEMETHLVTKPAVAIQPKGQPHCPVRVLKQTGPWIFCVLRPWGEETSP
jgi:hypothetical protein